MSKPLRSHVGIKRLQLSRGSGESRLMEYGMIAALGAIILGAIGYFVYTTFLGGGSGGPSISQDMKFKCTNPDCGKEHARSPKDMSGGDPESMMMMEDAGMARMDCPHCKAKKSCLIMTKCPECGTYYLAASTLQIAEQAARGGGAVSPPPTAAVRDVCPKCGTDRMEWYRKKYKDRKGKK